MKSQKFYLPEILFNFLVCFAILTIASTSFLATNFTARKIGNFILDHNFAVEKYSGTLYYSFIESQDGIFATVADSEGGGHALANQFGKRTYFITDKHGPKDEAQVQVLELKIYNSRTGEHSSINIVW